MKKILSIVLSIVMLFSICTFASAEGVTMKKIEKANDAITLVIDGKMVDCAKYGQEPVIVEGRTLVPLRSVFEALGATVEWNNETRSVVSEKGNVKISLAIDSRELYVNGEVKTIDVPACLMNDRTMVPVRAVAEAFGCKVDWNNDLRAVVIVSKIAEVEEADVPEDEETPSQVAEKFFNEIKALNFAKALDYVDVDKASPEFAQLAQVNGIKGVLAFSGYGDIALTDEQMKLAENLIRRICELIEIKCTDEKITGDTATVMVTITIPDFESINIDAESIISEEEAVMLYEKVLEKHGYTLIDIYLGTITDEKVLEAIENDIMAESVNYVMEYLENKVP